jgi:hypothetical protein
MPADAPRAAASAEAREQLRELRQILGQAAAPDRDAATDEAAAAAQAAADRAARLADQLAGRSPAPADAASPQPAAPATPLLAEILDPRVRRVTWGWSADGPADVEGSFDAGGLSIRWPDPWTDQEFRLHRHKIAAALAYARANRLDRIAIDPPGARLGIATVGKSYLDVRQALVMLGIDEAAGSLIFAGDVPEGSYARLMRANLDRLIDGATGAASATRSLMGETPASLALLVSCVGRKLVLGVRTDEELEVVREVVGPACTLAGFYSYGEISPLTPGARCELHNQTMTISTFAEV